MEDEKTKQDPAPTPAPTTPANPPVEPPVNKPAEAEKESAGELIGKANAAAERLEKANAEQARLLAQQERLNVEKTLGGKAEAGAPPPEESAVDYKNRVMGGDIGNS